MLFMEDDLVPETEALVEVTSEPLYCLCQEPWDKHNRRFMIQCDHCKDWFHGSCVNLQEHDSYDIEKYHCPKCVPLVGPSQNKEVYNHHRHDYTDKEAGKKPIQAGTHDFIAKLKEKNFLSADDIIIRLRGNNLTLPYLMQKGFHRPIIVDSAEGLGLRVPPEAFGVKDVESYVGCERMLDVIDVQRQTDVKMTMREFTEYFCSPARNKLYNLISLEFSKTNLNRLVDAPDIARKLDWVATCWPKNLDEEIAQRPEVSKYCLVSVKDSYTDFHVDFGGTSVWYHVLWGEKVFYLIEPTPANLALYARWMASVDQYESFFADSVDQCYRCVLKKGQTLFIPTGWIHAVLTSTDSLVFGGNFLHSLNMDLQLQIYEIEKKLKVPAKYLYPGFEATHWFAVRGVVDTLESLNGSGSVPHHILTGAKTLLSALRLWHSDKLIHGPNYVGKYRREFIPPTINPGRLIKELSREVRIADKRFSALRPSKVGEEKSFVRSPDSIKERILNKKKEKMRSREVSPKLKPEVISTKETELPSDDIGAQNKVLYTISKLPKGDEKNPLCNSPSRPEPQQQGQKQVTPIKLKLTMSSRSHGQDSVDHPSTVSIKLWNGDGGDRKVDGGGSVANNNLTQLQQHKDHLPKLRLSLGEGRVEMIEADDKMNSDYALDSDNELKIDTDEEKEADSDNNTNNSRSNKSKKHHKSKLRRKNERNAALDEMLAGTLDGINELIKSSNYPERINAFTKDSSPMVQESFQEMLSMGEGIGSRKGKRKYRPKQSGYDFEEAIEKVHQDDDFIYLPLAGSDDEGGKPAKRKRQNKDEDDNWSPRVKVGRINPREHHPSRIGARREHVEKGLEKAAAKLATMPDKPMKRKYKARKKKEEGIKGKPTHMASISETAGPSSSLVKVSQVPTGKGAAAVAKANLQKKPKKGMATPKQRLGKILGIHKFSKF